MKRSDLSRSGQHHPPTCRSCHCQVRFRRLRMQYLVSYLLARRKTPSSQQWFHWSRAAVAAAFEETRYGLSHHQAVAVQARSPSSRHCQHRH